MFAQNGPLAIVLPVLIKQDFNNQVRLLGALLSVYAAGAIGSAIVFGRMPRIRHRGVIIYSALFVSSLSVLVMGFHVPAAVLLLSAGVRGIANGAFNLVWETTLQEQVPSEQLGRIASIDVAMSLALFPLGYALAAFLITIIDPHMLFIAGGLISALAAVIGWLHPGLKKLNTL